MTNARFGRAQVLALLAGAGELIVGGSFTHAGSIETGSVAAWSEDDGWREVSPDHLRSDVTALARGVDGTIYAVARITDDAAAPYHVLALDGTSWRTIGSADRIIDEIAVDRDGTLLAGGFFTRIDGVAAPRLARWDGVAWAGVDHPGFSVEAILVDELETCIAGREGGNSGYAACRAALTWDHRPLPAQPGPEYPNPINALTRDASGALVAGGALVLDVGPSGDQVARWDGSAWQLLGPGLSGGREGVWDLAREAAGAIWAVGEHTQIGDDPFAPGAFAPRVARWDGRWQSVGGVQGGFGDDVHAVAVEGAAVYVGGGLTQAFLERGPFFAASGIARYRAGRWSALRERDVAAHGVGDTDLVAARGLCTPIVIGMRMLAGEQGAIGPVAQLDDDDVLRPWSDDGLDARGMTTVARGRDGALWLGGRGLRTFLPTAAEGALAMGQHGAGWTIIPGATGGGDTTVTSVLLTPDDETLYVAGTFAPGHPLSSTHLASLRGDAWGRVGARDVGPVQAMALDDEGALWIVEAVDDTHAQVERWDGSAWTSFGPPLDGAAGEILLRDGTPIVRMAFYSAMPVRALEGDAWVSFESADAPPVVIADIELLGDRLLAVGELVIDGAPHHGLAEWDGTMWRAHGPSFDGFTKTLALTARGIVVGGAFDAVGTQPSWGLARLERP